MCNISNKEILEDKQRQNNNQKYVKQSNLKRFSMHELNDYKNKNKIVSLTKKQLKKYHWEEIDKLCGALGLKRGGKKDEMIEVIKSKQYYH